MEELSQSIPTLAIPSNLCRRAGIAAEWQSINNLSVFPTQKIVPTIDRPSPFASDTQLVSLFHLRPDTVLFKPILRKLVNEANGVFLTVQTIARPSTEGPGDDLNNRNELLKLSREYRSIIRACLESLQEEIMRAQGAQRVELQSYITVFYSVECVWHLCEILLVDSSPGNIVLPHLLNWVRFHFPKYERNAAQMLVGASSDVIGMERHYPEYWDTVIGSVLQGRTKVVIALLRLHSDGRSEHFRTAEQCLKAMPVYSVMGGVSVEQFQLQHRHWMVDVQAKIDAKVFISCYNLNLIMKISVGDEIAWSEIQQHCETWYELLAAWMFYTKPCVKSFELGQFAKQCVLKMSLGSNGFKTLDRVLLAAMEFDILKVVKEVQNITDSGWFVTHLTDLLYHGGRLNNLIDDADFCPQKLRESFIIEYATVLCGHKSLWQVALSYLDHCPSDGLQIQKLLIPKITLDTEKKVQKIVQEALSRNLVEVAQNICKVQGMRECKNRGRLGNALAWALKSHDSSFVSYVADLLLREYSKSGDLTNVDLLDNLGSSILAGDRLIFLGKYYEFHKLYHAREYKEAANLLVSLLESKLIPHYFWDILITETIPLLECEEMVLSATDTFIILQALEEESSHGMKDKIDILRLAAARNLARALIV